MTDLVIIAVLSAVLIPAICYMVKEKKKGSACIGCPNGGKCKKHDCCKK